MLCEGKENKRYVTWHGFHWDLVTRQVSMLTYSTQLSKPLTNKLCALGENAVGGWKSYGSLLLPAI